LAAVRHSTPRSDALSHRWYVLAHSQGTIPAFNGLMETAYQWLRYLDPLRLQRLRDRKLAGQPLPTAKPSVAASGPAPETMPRRPTWANPGEIAYRRRIFRNFRGFLTFGSPLGKFATIWPALVPVSREPAFHRDAKWINVFDPIDPVSGVLRTFEEENFRSEKGSEVCCPELHNLGYRAGSLLLANHLKYFARRKEKDVDFAVIVSRWLLTGDVNSVLGASCWFVGRDRTFKRRQRLKRASWLIGAGIEWGVGALLVPRVIDAAVRRVAWVRRFVEPPVPRRSVRACSLLLAAGLPAVVGLFNRAFVYSEEAENPRRPRTSSCPGEWALEPEDPFP
jgi:hypothetical protein